jgi:hypothetical protein
LLGRLKKAIVSLRSFKLNWGTREEILGYSTMADDAPTRVRAGPSPLVRTAIRRSPVAVARIIGELLYKIRGIERVIGSEPPRVASGALF